MALRRFCCSSKDVFTPFDTRPTLMNAFLPTLIFFLICMTCCATGLYSIPYRPPEKRPFKSFNIEDIIRPLEATTRHAVSANHTDSSRSIETHTVLE